MSLALRNRPMVAKRAVKHTTAQEGAPRTKRRVSPLECGNSGRKQPAVYHDLDHLAGSWSVKEARAFDCDLARQRTIDKDIWR